MTAALRLYSEDSAAPPQMTLRAAYETYKLPEIDGRRASATTLNYRTALGHWERFCSLRVGTISTDTAFSPPIGCPSDDVYRITDRDLDAFARWLREHRPGGPGLSVGTVEKTWKPIRSILRKIGPRETGNPRGEGLLDRIPVMDSVGDLAGYGGGDVSDGATDITVDQLGSLYDACAVAEWPRSTKVPASVQWRCYLVLAAVMGLRVNNLAMAKCEWFVLQELSPAKGSNRTHAGGWLCFVPKKTERSKRARLIIPMPACVRTHVEALVGQGRDRMFDFGAERNDSARLQWQAIAAQAGCPHIHRCDLRDAANQLWGAVDRDLGRWVCGHAARDVNERHYTRIEPDLIAAIPRLVLPKQFERHPQGIQQPLLF